MLCHVPLFSAKHHILTILNIGHHIGSVKTVFSDFWFPLISFSFVSWRTEDNWAEYFQNVVLLRTAYGHSSHNKNDNWVDSSSSMYQMQTNVDQISNKLWSPIRQPTRSARFFTPRASRCVCPVTLHYGKPRGTRQTLILGAKHCV